ncbi:MAG TPA: hypothetical protein VGD56_06065, partial [Gemmatirosa sp.]
ALVLVTYALLIEAWRRLLQGWGGRLAFWDGARIWTVSNLARYVPGTLWSVGAMSVLADDAGVPPTAAAGAAIFNTLLNLAAGFIVLSGTGADYIARLAPGVPYPRAFGAVIGIAGAVALPLCLPTLTGVAARLLRREPPSAPPLRTFVAALLSNLIAWGIYGVAFGCFSRALFPAAGATWLGYVAVFTGSYLTGFLALLAPGGLFVREAAMVYALTRTGMATPADAAVLAVASRLWLTVLELAPGLAFLAAGAVRAPRPRRSVS